MSPQAKGDQDSTAIEAWESEQQKKKRLLAHCDDSFLPYVEKVLNRVPRDVRTTQILDDPSFAIVSFGSGCGYFVPFQDAKESLVLLNKSLLSEPEFQIIHTVAHEIAHKVARKGETGLHEKEAGELLLQWGFRQEVEAASYAPEFDQSSGYKLGYEWAKRQTHPEVLEVFEEFYDEWNEGRLTFDRAEELYLDADPERILREMGFFEGPEQDSPDNHTEEPLSYKDLEHGILIGVMHFLRHEKTKLGGGHRDPKEAEGRQLLQSAQKATEAVGALISKLRPNAQQESELCDSLKTTLGLLSTFVIGLLPDETG